ncbi:MAG: hypothetical protein M1828_004012 [Chrysothrix sp. TS-e1954]|nr:MAG: hypothetical protein M1828_004012 [Chrysothrix sp. TS-e1954]
MDAVSAIGIAASIATFLSIGYRVVERLNEYQLTSREIPKALKDVSLRLPVLLLKIRDVEKLCANGEINVEHRDAIQRVVEGCKRQVVRLDTLLSTLVPQKVLVDGKKRDSRLSLTVKGLKSIYKDKELHSIQQSLQAYESTLTFYFVAPSSDHNDAASDASTSELIFDVPAIACSAFIGRKELLETIDTNIGKQSESTEFNTVVLLGMGGQGKTQIAYEYCRRVKTRRAIFWIDATSEAMVQRAFERIAAHMQNDTFVSTNAAVAYVTKTLANASYPFTVVFDNFDEPHTFKDIMMYLPRTRNGNFIFTSRHGDSVALGQQISVPMMSTDEGRTLLLTRLGIEETTVTRKNADGVVMMLGYLPLAIDQAASYIRARSLPLEDFKDHFDKRKQHILTHTPSVWAYRRQLMDIEQETKLSVFTSWELSFIHLGRDKAEREPYKRILTLAAFLDYTHVGQTFFMQYNQSCCRLDSNFTAALSTDGQWDPFKFQDVVVRLRTFSLIQSMTLMNDETYLGLHPLVAEWLKCRLSSAELKTYVDDLTKTLRSLIVDFPKAKRTWTHRSLTEVLRHIETFLTDDRLKSAKDQISTDHSFATLDFVHFFMKLDRFFGGRFQFEKPGKMQQIDNELVLSDKYLGEICLFRGNLVAAEIHDIRALEQARRNCGPSDLRTLAAMDQLAFLYYTKAEFSAAEHLWTNVLSIHEEHHAQKFTAGLKPLRALGDTYRLQGRFPEASAMLHRAHEEALREYGPNHHMTARVVDGLAILLRDQGQCAAAQTIFEKSVDCFEKTLGPYHISCMAGYVNMGFIKEDQGLMVDAKHWYAMMIRGPQPPPDPRNAPLKDPDILLPLLKRLIKDFNYWDGFLNDIITDTDYTDSCASDTLTRISKNL